ncbi:MAG TPA: TetR/AcrR family transcriptional regulator [Thermoanaerobaculia bacterium]|nr:TetR/AcrR family transcriptional regulator [Thermoanaerobaculia bacterium]
MAQDRRIARTRETLHQALIDLLIESPYDSITIQQVLDRANVGRSTFYTHFKDKDDLLVAGVDNLRELLAAHRKTGDPIAFSRALFEHVHEHRKVYRAQVLTPVWPRIRQRIQDLLADLVRREYKPRRSKIPPELVAHFVASTFMSVLTWWLDRRTGLSPAEIDALFRELVTRGMGG